jgi:hypothetical protein
MLKDITSDPDIAGISRAIPARMFVPLMVAILKLKGSPLHVI